LVFAAVRPGIAAKLPSAGLWLNASKSESMPEGDDSAPRRGRRVRIGFGPGPQQVGDGTPREEGRLSRRIATWLRVGINTLQTT